MRATTTFDFYPPSTPDTRRHFVAGEVIGGLTPEDVDLLVAKGLAERDAPAGEDKAKPKKDRT